ncbi:MAG: CDP-alcohol phosphatidyltransferase family protein [Candidatus Magasanikbacteria bacterium]|nr:CDP-alcohol phosphatidyltransferase family protein [Candidatus Magasanikbacteria bacterium]
MSLAQKWQIEKKDLFTFLPATEIHHHDRLLAKTFLKLLPRSVTPNQITIFRLIVTPLVFWITYQENYILGIIAFLLVAFTDALDGSLARTQNKITKFGILFDPLADKILISSMVLLLVFRFLNPWLGAAVIGMEIIFIISALVFKYKFKKVLMANIWGKIKMVLQITAVFLILLGLLLNYPILLTVASGVFGLVIGFAIVSLFTYGI